MKNIQIYENFKLTRMYGISGAYINKDKSVNVNNHVYLRNKGLDIIPIKFNKIFGVFDCSNNNLTTLINSPVYVELDFICCKNELTNLLKGPKTVGGDYKCEENNLKNMYGFPENFKGHIGTKDNPVHEIVMLYSDQNKYDNPTQKYNGIKNKFIYWLNEYKVIRNGNAIVQGRLEEALFEIGIEKLEKTEFKNYRLI